MVLFTFAVGHALYLLPPPPLVLLQLALVAPRLVQLPHAPLVAHDGLGIVISGEERLASFSIVIGRREEQDFKENISVSLSLSYHWFKEHCSTQLRNTCKSLNWAAH